MKTKNSKLGFAKQTLLALGILKDREREILTLRYGLENEPFWTLEKIGKKYGVTRERARQIINSTKKRLLKLQNPKLDELFKSIEKVVKQKGDIISEKYLVTHFGSESEPEILGSVSLVAEVDSKLNRLKVDHLDVFWTITKIKNTKVDKIAHSAHDILEKGKSVIVIEKLIALLKKDFPKYSETFLKSILIGSYNLLTIRGVKIGLVSWPEINPRNTRNKIHYVLDYANKPLHFRTIQDRIKNYDFNGKVPSVATVHNELIADDRFVLIGKGIYALKKWGYAEGTVSDVIMELLKDKKAMAQDKIIETVLEKRQVARNTIMMNLISKPYFQRVGERVWEYKK